MSAVTNHGVPDSVVQDQFLASREFFGLPEPVKLAVEVCPLHALHRAGLAVVHTLPLLQADGKSRGYTPLGEQTLDPQNQRKGDTKVRHACTGHAAASHAC